MYQFCNTTLRYTIFALLCSKYIKKVTEPLFPYEVSYSRYIKYYNNESPNPKQTCIIFMKFILLYKFGVNDVGQNTMVKTYLLTFYNPKYIFNFILNIIMIYKAWCYFIDANKAIEGFLVSTKIIGYQRVVCSQQKLDFTLRLKSPMELKRKIFYSKDG